MVRKYLVDITEQGNLILADNLYDFCDSIVMLLADINRFAGACRNACLLNEQALIIG